MYQHIPGVYIQHDQGTQRRTILFGKLASYQRDNVVNLTAVQLKIIIQSLELTHKILKEIHIMEMKFASPNPW